MATVWDDALTIYHDPSDDHASVAVSHQIASGSNRAQVVEVSGPGHFRILRHPTVMDGIAQLATRNTSVVSE